MSVSPSPRSNPDASTVTDHGVPSYTKYVVDNLANPETSENVHPNEGPPNMAQVNFGIEPQTTVNITLYT